MPKLTNPTRKCRVSKVSKENQGIYSYFLCLYIKKVTKEKSRLKIFLSDDSFGCPSKKILGRSFRMVALAGYNDAGWHHSFIDLVIFSGVEVGM